MTTTAETTAPSPQLRRPTRHRYRGVSTALARTTGTDVLLWRVLFVVLVFFDGLGILLYLAGLFAIPRKGEPQSLAERLFRGPNRRLGRGDVLLVALLVLCLAGALGSFDGVLALLVIAGVVFLFLRSRNSDGPESTEPVPAAPLVQPAGSAPVQPLPELPDPVTKRPRSVLGTLTTGTALLVSSVLVLLNATDTVDIQAEVILAAALLVIGAGIVASAWWGRSLVLVPVAIVLGLALAATSVARPAIDAGIGERTWAPTGSADYRLGVGEATLDLRGIVVQEALPTRITAQVDVGHLIVLVPDDLRIALHAEAEWGELIVLGDKTHGRNANRDDDLGPEGSPQLLLDASVRTGQVEVRRG